MSISPRPEYFDVNTGRWITQKMGPFDRNQLFMDEMRHWLSCVKGVQDPMIPVEEGNRRGILARSPAGLVGAGSGAGNTR